MGVAVVENDFLVHFAVSRRTRDPVVPVIKTNGLSENALFADGSTKISEHPAPLVSDISTDQTHLTFTSFMACPRFIPGMDHSRMVPLDPPVSKWVGFFFVVDAPTNLMTDIPSLPFDDELFEPLIVIRGKGVLEDATSYK